MMRQIVLRTAAGRLLKSFFLGLIPDSPFGVSWETNVKTTRVSVTLKEVNVIQHEALAAKGCWRYELVDSLSDSLLIYGDSWQAGVCEMHTEQYAAIFKLSIFNYILFSAGKHHKC